MNDSSHWLVNFSPGKFLVVPYWGKTRIRRTKVPYGWMYRINEKRNEKSVEKRRPTPSEAKEYIERGIYLMSISKGWR